MDPGVWGPPPNSLRDQFMDWLIHLILLGWLWTNFISRWAWVSNRTLNIIATSASCISLVEIHYLIIQKLNHEAYKSALLLGAVCILLVSLSLWFMVTDIYVQWIIFVGDHLHQRRWREVLPKWLVLNLTTSLALFLVKIDSVLHFMIAGTLTITVVAMLSRAYHGRDPSGLTKGLTCCFIICSLIFLEEIYVENQQKGRHLITSLVTLLICLACLIAPPPPPDEVVQAAGQPPPPSPLMRWLLERVLDRIERQLAYDDLQFERFTRPYLREVIFGIHGEGPSTDTATLIRTPLEKLKMLSPLRRSDKDARNHSLSVSASKNSENSSCSFRLSKLVPTNKKLKVQSDFPQGVSEEKGAGCSMKVEHEGHSRVKVGVSEKVGCKRIRLEMSASSTPLEDGMICASTADPVLKAPVVTSPQDDEMSKSYIQNDESEKDIHAAHRKSIDNTEASEVSETSLEGQRKPALDQAVLPAMTGNLVSSELEEDRGNLQARVCRELGEESCTDAQLWVAPWMTPVGGGDNACVSCKFGGTLLRCNGEGCKKGFHLIYLDPPLKNVPIRVCHCVCCVKKKVKSGVHSLSGGVGSILDAKEVELADSEGVQKQYLVKFRCLAHVHNSWVPESQLFLEPPVLIGKFKQSQVVKWKPEWA